MKHRLLWKFVLVCCLMVLLALPVFANSAEPPCLTIVVVSAPDDLELALEDVNYEEAYQLSKQKSVRGWETYFRFRYSTMYQALSFHRQRQPQTMRQYHLRMFFPHR